MADLIEKWQKGEEDAFEAIFHQYYNMVRKTAVGIMNDGSFAEDIAQDVFVSAVNIYKLILNEGPIHLPL